MRQRAVWIRFSLTILHWEKASFVVLMLNHRTKIWTDMPRWFWLSLEEQRKVLAGDEICVHYLHSESKRVCISWKQNIPKIQYSREFGIIMNSSTVTSKILFGLSIRLSQWIVVCKFLKEIRKRKITVLIRKISVKNFNFLWWPFLRYDSSFSSRCRISQLFSQGS